jgi:hypothetical protein
LAFEDYVKGVVYGEVGVFANMSSVDGASLTPAQRQSGSAEVFKTLAVGSRSYALYWYLSRQASDPGYDIRDGTCEQVYESARNLWIDDAVNATAGQVLLSANSLELEKLEYASSCKRLGTLPYGISAVNPSCAVVVPDTTGIVACVGSWCGHETSNMGHQEHPCDPSRCRCLVRGLCQWGAAERSFAGESYASILAHYQPNTVLFTLGSTYDANTPPRYGKLIGYVRANDIYAADAGIAGATVSLSTGATTTTDADGYYEFLNLEASQTALIHVSATSFSPTDDSKYLDPNFSVWWKSFALFAQHDDAGVIDDNHVFTDSQVLEDTNTSWPDVAIVVDANTIADSTPSGIDKGIGGGCISACAGYPTSTSKRVWLVLFSAFLLRRSRMNKTSASLRERR